MSSNVVSFLSSSSYQTTFEFIRGIQQNFPRAWFYKPVGIEVEVTNQCNLQCEGCGLRDEEHKPENILSTDDNIDILNQCKKEGLRCYSLTGGEVFLYLDRIKKIICSVSGLDLYKLNTNGFAFKTPKRTKQLLEELKSAGFSANNHYLKPVLVISIGQQTKAGIPLENAVNAVSQFYSCFSPDEAICTLNITDKDKNFTQKALDDFKSLYFQKTGKVFDETLFPTRLFSLNYVPTLTRLGIDETETISIRELIHDFQHRYRTGDCFNRVPDKEITLSTLIPRATLRPNGDMYACSGFNHVHKLGNYYTSDLHTILTDTNNNKALKTVMTQGLEGLLNMREKETREDLGSRLVSKSYFPCDICQMLLSKKEL